MKNFKNSLHHPNYFNSLSEDEDSWDLNTSDWSELSEEEKESEETSQNEAKLGKTGHIEENEEKIDHNLEEKNKIQESIHKVALFDWDDTLFCTKYFEMLQIDYKAIFSEQKSIEDFGAYLIYEMQLLEEVIKEKIYKIIYYLFLLF